MIVYTPLLQDGFYLFKSTSTDFKSKLCYQNLSTYILRLYNTGNSFKNFVTSFIMFIDVFFLLCLIMNFHSYFSPCFFFIS